MHGLNPKLGLAGKGFYQNPSIDPFFFFVGGGVGKILLMVWNKKGYP